MKIYNVTGMSLSIVDRDNIVYSQGFGFANQSSGKPVNSKTLFKIGSITKVFTASAIMQLVELGKIDIDLPVKAYIPEFNVKSRFSCTKDITVRDILCHHSGLPCDDFRNYFSFDTEEYKTVVQFLQGSYTCYPPGKMFYYSNLGANLLGVIIERVSGMPYHQYIETVLLKGLHMDHSAIVLPEEQKQDLSKPYSNGKEQTEDMIKVIPAGGIISSSEDMGKFMMSLLNNGKWLFINAETLEDMFEPQYPNNSLDMSFVNGLGWFIGKPGLDYAGKVIWLDGGTPNYFSLTVVIPERKLGISLLTNSSTGALLNHELSVDILNLILNAKFGIKPPLAKGKEQIEVTPEIIQSVTGRFITLSGIVSVICSGKKLNAKLPSGTVRLIPCKDGWFNVRLLLLGVIPLKLKKLSMIRFSVVNIDGERVFCIEQLGFRSPQGKEFKQLNITEAWKKRVGKYTCCSEKNPLFKYISLCCNNGETYLSTTIDKLGRLRLYLDSINDSEAVIYGYGRGSGETVFATGDKISVFGLEFKNNN